MPKELLSGHGTLPANLDSLITPLLVNLSAQTFKPDATGQELALETMCGIATGRILYGCVQKAFGLDYSPRDAGFYMGVSTAMFQYFSLGSRLAESLNL